MEYEDYYLVAKSISLAMTAPTVILGAGVIYMWGPASIRAVRTNTLDAQGWFVIGVIVAFLGSVVDNIYWSLPWTASFFEMDATGDLMEVGVLFNIVFRQTSGIFAAYCHLRAAAESSRRRIRAVNYLMAVSNFSAVLVIAVLWYMRSM